MNIREATIDDFEELVQLNKDVFINNPQFDNDIIEDFMETDIGREFMKKAISDDEGIFIVIEENAKLIAYANGSKKDIPYRKSRYFEISNLGVLPEYKGKGIGKLLLERIEEKAKEKGFNKIYLECYTANSEALNFYKKNGYKDIDTSLEKTI